jgi:hypothetical protein
MNCQTSLMKCRVLDSIFAVRLRILLFALSFCFLGGCASTSYMQNISKSSFIDKLSVKLPLDRTTEQLIAEVGKQRTGFVQPDTSPERILVEQAFPPIEFNAEALSLLDRSYFDKVGQVIAWGIDLDSRTTGFLKHQGAPLSVTGRFTFDSMAAINSAAVQGATTTLISSVATGFQVTPGTSAVAGGIGVGLIGGMIAGGITASAVESTIKGFVSAKTFVDRLPHASGLVAHQVHIPRMRATYMETIDSKAIKVMFARTAEKNIDYSSRIFFASTVGVYRGPNFAQKYPETNGWEFIVTNLNFIDAKIVEGDPQATVEAIRLELKKRGVSL